MKVLINKTHEIEVDEKFRDMFPMNGCEGIDCERCPFCIGDTDKKCFLILEDADTYDFTAEIVEE